MDELVSDVTENKDVEDTTATGNVDEETAIAEEAAIAEAAVAEAAVAKEAAAEEAAAVAAVAAVVAAAAAELVAACLRSSACTNSNRKMFSMMVTRDATSSIRMI